MWTEQQLRDLEEQQREREERTEFMREGGRILKENPDMKFIDLPTFCYKRSKKECKKCNNYDCNNKIES